ncbi:hypothetical protein QP62_00175, partial [Staphylococcus aureus]
MVLDRRDDDLVARPDIGSAVGGGDEGDRLRRSSQEDDVVLRRRVQEAAHGFAAALEQVGGTRRERVRGPVDVRVVAAVELARRVDDALRLVGRRRVVEPDQRVAVHALVERREVAAHALHVEGRGDRARPVRDRPRRRAGAL